jgi:hypothetical protein
MMQRRPAIFTRFRVKRAQAAPVLIALGVALLLGHAAQPVLPVLTAVALVSLGASITTITRLNGSPSLRLALAAHLFCYAAIYLLFVGAVLDGSLRGPQATSLTFAQSLDLSVSAGLMAALTRMCVSHLFRPGTSRAE